MVLEVVNNIPEGFPTYGANIISYVSADGEKLYLNQHFLRIMINGENDLYSLIMASEYIPIGSEAFLPDESRKWRLDSSMLWQEIVVSGEDGNDSGSGSSNPR